jgi:hypothetical protein
LICRDGVASIADILLERDGNSVFTVVPDAGGAVGAKRCANAEGLTQSREQNAGYYHRSKNQRRIPCGLANNTTVDLRVNWPTGRADTCSHVAAEHGNIATAGGGIQQANY